MDSLTLEQAEYFNMFPEEAATVGVTQEQIDAVLSGNDDYYNIIPEDRDLGIGSPFMPPEAADASNIDELQDITDNKREASEAAASADSLSYKGLYGTQPYVSQGNRIVAAIQDFGNAMTTTEEEPSHIQQAVIDQPEAKAKWYKKSVELYNRTGKLQEDGSRVYTEYKMDPNDPTKTIATDFLIPEPNNTVWERIAGFGRRVFGEGAKDIAKDAYGISQGQFTTDTSEYSPATPEDERGFAANTPSMQRDGGEKILSDLWTVAIPTMAVAKGVQVGSRSIKALATANKAARLGYFGNIASTTVAGSIVEALAVSESDEGLLIRKEFVKDQLSGMGLKNVSDEVANDIAVLLDGLLINGGLDGLLTFIAPLFRFGARKTKTATSLANIDGVTNAVRDGVTLKVAQFLDPTLASDGAMELTRKLKVLSRTLRHDAVVGLKIGDFEKEIPVPTTQALMTGSDAYIRETRQHLQDTMSEEAFEELVQTEADAMFQRMVAILRSNSSNPAVAGTDAALLQEMGDFIVEAGEARLPASARTNPDEVNPSDLQETLDTTVSNLGRQLEGERYAAQADVDAALANRDAIQTRLDNVVADDPSFDLLTEDFTNMQLTGDDRKALSDWTQSTAYPVFSQQKEAVEAAFKAIPNTPIGPEAAEALFEEILGAVSNINVFDSSGTQAKAALGKIYSVLTNVKMTDKTIVTQIFGPNGDFVMDQFTVGLRPETRREFFERLGGTIGFQDVYNLRPALNGLYDTYSKTNKTAANKFSRIKKHISAKTYVDSEGVTRTGQLGFSSGETRAAAEQADQLYKDFDNRWRNDDRIKQLSSVLDEQRAKRNLDPSEVTSKNQGATDSSRAMEEYVNTAMDEPSGAGFTQLYEAIDETMGHVGPTTPFMGDLIMARMMERLSILATEGMDEIGLKQQIAPAIKQLRAAGDDESADRLAQMVVGIGQRRRDLGDELLGAEESLKQAKEKLKSVEKSLLNDLMSKVERRSGGVGRPTRTDSREAIVDIISRPDTNNTIELLAEIEKLPTSQKLLARQALQSVALDTIGTKIFGSSITGFKGGKPIRNILPSQIQKLSKAEAGGLLKNLDLIFPEEALDPTTQSVRDGVFNSLEVLYSSAGPTFFRDVAVGSNTAILTQIGKETKDAVSTSILVLAGYMNPTAAMLRRLTASSIDEIMRVEKEVAAQTLAVIITSPTEFATLVDEMMKRSSRERVAQAAKIALRAARIDGRYQIRIREEEQGQQSSGGNPVLNSIASIIGPDMTEAALGTLDFMSPSARKGDWPE
jgi:hypothetical protein